MIKKQEQCQTNADCAAITGESGGVCQSGTCVISGPDYSCLGKAPPDPGSGTLDVQARFTLLGSDLAPLGLEVRVCEALDIDCQRPQAVLSPDATGLVVLELNLGFSGYVEAVSDETLPTQLVFSSPVDQNTSIKGYNTTGDPRVPLFTLTQLAALSSSIGPGVSYDVSKASMFFTVADCDNTPAPGLYIKLPPDQTQTSLVYVDAGAPNPDLDATGADGQLAIVNFNPGLVKIEMREKAGDRLISKFAVPMKAGRITFLTAEPNQ